jgi:hypothetical protein
MNIKLSYLTELSRRKKHGFLDVIYIYIYIYILVYVKKVPYKLESPFSNASEHIFRFSVLIKTEKSNYIYPLPMRQFRRLEKGALWGEKYKD